MSVRDSCSIRALFEKSAPEGKLNLETTNRDNIINLAPSTAFSLICKSKQVWLRWTRGRSSDQHYSPSRHSLTMKRSLVGFASFPLLNGGNWHHLEQTLPLQKRTLYQLLPGSESICMTLASCQQRRDKTKHDTSSLLPPSMSLFLTPSPHLCPFLSHKVPVCWTHWPFPLLLPPLLLVLHIYMLAQDSWTLRGLTGYL